MSRFKIKSEIGGEELHINAVTLGTGTAAAETLNKFTYQGKPPISYPIEGLLYTKGGVNTYTGKLLEYEDGATKGKSLKPKVVLIELEPLSGSVLAAAYNLSKEKSASVLEEFAGKTGLKECEVDEHVLDFYKDVAQNVNYMKVTRI